MKIVVAIDSFKGSLSSMEAGNGVKKGIQRVFPDADIIVRPLADGGEGTTEALINGLDGEKITIPVMGPMGETVEAEYGYFPKKKQAIIEIATAAGITLLQPNQLNPFRATTYGVGEIIRDAVGRGCRDFIIGIGGSATNDGGLGMLTALGYEFLDASGVCVGITADSLGKISKISDELRMPELSQCRFQIACDVNNPLCGANGATYIYGPQKGVTEQAKDQLDQSMASFAEATAVFLKEDYSQVPGAGAAGGMGFALRSYLSGELCPGIELVMKEVQLEEDIKTADLVVTGEGRLDGQTAMGKAPIGIAELAKKYHKKVIAFAGCVTVDAAQCNEQGIDAFFPILRQAVTLQEAMDRRTALSNLIAAAEQVFRLIHMFY